MKTKYTRKQIEEAIAYWQGVLDKMSCMNESKSKLLDLCSAKFTEEIVFSAESKFELTENNIKTLYDIFDQYFFSGKLSTVKMLSIFIGDKQSLNKIILNYTNGVTINLDNYLALYQPDQQKIYLPNGKYTIRIRKDAIFINTESHAYASFSYIAQALFHEMMHAYDMHFGGLFRYMMWALVNNAPLDVIDYNSHLTKVFKEQKAKFEMDTNIELRISGDNVDFNDLCRKAAENIHLLNEDELNKMAKKVFSKETADFYKDSQMIQFSDDCQSFSFSFGIPMPK